MPTGGLGGNKRRLLGRGAFDLVSKGKNLSVQREEFEVQKSLSFGGKMVCTYNNM